LNAFENAATSAKPTDLEAYYWSRPADGRQESERFQIGFWMRQLADRCASLEGVALYKGSPRVRLPGVPAAEARQLQRALSALEQSVLDEEPFGRVLQIVTAGLAAADRLGLRAAGAPPNQPPPRR
jgi:hypothetical protein